MDEPLPLLVAVLGPTCSGKSGLALALARRFGGEIISCDSMQIYRGLDIGTAKVPLADRAAVPHHLIDIRDPGQPFSAGDFAALASAAIEDIHSRDRLPILAGGTGFYVRALLDGLFEGPGRDEELRMRLQTRSSPVLWRFLRKLDPASAARIHPNDKNKIIRAVEVCLRAGQPLSQAHDAGRAGLQGFRVLRVLLDPPRSALYERINQRCLEMFQAGLADETRQQLNRGLARDSQPMLAVGYRQIIPYLDGLISESEALEKARQATRNYAKRQLTWFRREPELVVFDDFGDNPQIADRAMEAVSVALSVDSTAG